MNLLELKKPLVQSALVLLAIFILIGFVAGAETQGFFGGIAAIFSGIFYTILFAIGITIALLFSLLLLFAIFLGAVAIYSPDSARDMYHALRSRIMMLLSPWLSRLARDTGAPNKSASPSSSFSSSQPTSPAMSSKEPVPLNAVTEVRQEFQNEIAAIEREVSQLTRENQNLSQAVSHLKSSVNDLPVDQVVTTTTALENQQRELSASLSHSMQRIEEIAAATEKNDRIAQQQSAQLREAQDKITLLTNEIEDLKRTVKAATAKAEENGNGLPDDGHRIFSYLEKEEERKLFADLIEEAVSKEMTYTEIDDFLSKSLPKKVDAIIKVHPSLTREYIRLRRQK